MRNALTERLVFIIAGGAILLSIPAASVAEPTTYVFEQTSSNVPGFEPSATITINGTFADLPTITDVIGFNTANPGPYDFGYLLGLSLEYPNPGVPGFPTVSFDLGNFIAPTFFGSYGEVPEWSISPEGIAFLEFENGFSFAFSPEGSITAADYEGSILCSQQNGCVADGNWVPVPEPSALSVLVAGLGLAGAAFYLERKKYPIG